VVFFIVLTSALLQGWSIPAVSRIMGLQAPAQQKHDYPIEFAPVAGADTQLIDLIIPLSAAVAGKPIVELGLPPDSLIVLISRSDDYLVPSGGTVLEEGDVVQVLVNTDNIADVRSILTRWKKPEEKSEP